MTKWISRASVLRIIDAEPAYSDVINEKTYMAEQIENLPVRKEEERPRGEWKDRCQKALAELEQATVWDSHTVKATHILRGDEDV